jgi:predicted Zn-dependent protease
VLIGRSGRSRPGDTCAYSPDVCRAIPSHLNHAIETNRPIKPEELLAWQLGGVTQEEIRAEVNTRGMASRPEESVMLKRPRPWDVFVEVARELRQDCVDDVIGTLREVIEKQPKNAWMHFVLASLTGREEGWLSAYDESSKVVKFAPQSPYIQRQHFYICSRARLGQPAETHARKMLALRPKDPVAHHAVGMALGTQGRTEEALRAYEEAARLQPSLAAAQFGIRTAQRNSGEIEVSIAA